MDKLMQSLIDAPLANPLRLNLVEVPGEPKKRVSRKRSLNMFDAPAPIVKNSREYKERCKAEKVTQLLDYYIASGHTAEQIHAYTKIDMGTIKRGMEMRGVAI